MKSKSVNLNSNTPRTDSARLQLSCELPSRQHKDIPLVYASFAEQLEVELNKAKEKCSRMESCVSRLKDVMLEYEVRRAQDSGSEPLPSKTFIRNTEIASGFCGECSRPLYGVYYKKDGISRCHGCHKTYLESLGLPTDGMASS